MATSSQIPDFDAADVRNGLRLAMTVGMPTEAADQPAFYMPVITTADGPTDQEGIPFSPTGKRTIPPRVPIKVTCGIEYRDSEGRLENFGNVSPSRVVLELLDEDYAAVEGFEFVVIGGNKFFYRRTEVPLGLVSVGIFRVHCASEGES